MSVDDDEDAKTQAIEDKYTKQIPPSSNGEEDKDTRDAVTKHRENFLSIYKEGNDNAADDQSNEPDLSQGIRYKTTADEDESGFELKTGGEN